MSSVKLLHTPSAATPSCAVDGRLEQPLERPQLGRLDHADSLLDHVDSLFDLGQVDARLPLPHPNPYSYPYPYPQPYPQPYP